MRKPEPRALALCLLAFLAWQAYGQSRPDALALYRAGRYEEARVACLAELERDASNMDSYVVLCWSLIGLERWSDAELYAGKAFLVRKDPRIVEVLGEAAFYLGKNAEAMAYFTSYITQLPDGSRVGPVYSFMGEIYLRTDKLNHADIALRTALQYDPRNVRWWTRLGFIRERLGDWRYALEAYESALKISPDFDDALRGRDRALAKLRR